MAWKKKRLKTKGRNKYYSVAKQLRRKKRTTEQFEIMLNTLTLEEVIALKLELAAKAAGGSLYGVPIWTSLRTIVSDAVLKFALSATKTKLEASRFLGIDKDNFEKMLKKYETKSFFEEEDS